MKKYIYIILGTISLVLGLLGIITPGLPTTPFILLTAFLYAKGSPRLHHKLLNNKLTGRYLTRVNRGLGVRGLTVSIMLMWCMIFFTAFVVFNYGTMRFVMLGLGLVGTISQIIVLRKRRKDTVVTSEMKEVENENEKELKTSKAS